MRVIIFSRLLKEEDVPYVQELIDVLYQENIELFVFQPYFEKIKNSISFHKDPQIYTGYSDLQQTKFDFMITLGGDGTILTAIAEVRDSGVPILGINLGRLGFLASIEKTKIREAINLLKRGMFVYDERRTIYLETDNNLFGEIRFALNDFTILKRDTSSMITIHTFINGAYLNSYWADGIIVSTPTGSTGYSLSCGGPIIFPNSGNFVLTPVAPHNLNVRPIVISDDSVISFEIEGRGENFLCTLDSRFETITSESELAVRKGDFNIHMVQLHNTNFLKTIRDKLTWGIDTRNH